MSQQIATTLRKAAKVMREGGYIKGRMWDSKGAHCALGAINVAKGFKDGRFGDIMPEATALSKMIDLPKSGIYDSYNSRRVNSNSDPYTIVAGWNNIQCNSGEQVACIMEATAELLEEETREGL